MMMFLTILFMSVLAIAVFCAMFAGVPSERTRSELRPAQKLSIDAPRFFAGDVARPTAPAPIPIEMLMSQIERHVRLEQAAAETFLDGPTPDALHSASASPMMN